MESCFQTNSLQYLGMKNPILRGVSPWFFIFRSMDSHATICEAVQPGLNFTKLRISSFRRRSLASFCVPLAMVCTCHRWYLRKVRGNPGGPTQNPLQQWQHNFPTWLCQFLGVGARTWLRCLVSQCSMHPMYTEFDTCFNQAISFGQL